MRYLHVTSMVKMWYNMQSVTQFPFVFISLFLRFYDILSFVRCLSCKINLQKNFLASVVYTITLIIDHILLLVQKQFCRVT